MFFHFLILLFLSKLQLYFLLLGLFLKQERGFQGIRQGTTMCLGAPRWESHLPSHHSHGYRCRIKKSKFRVRLPSRKSCSWEEWMEIELQNLKLYLENRCIIEENERLKRRALVLDQENKALLSEIKKKLSHQDDII